MLRKIKHLVETYNKDIVINWNYVTLNTLYVKQIDKHKYEIMLNNGIVIEIVDEREYNNSVSIRVYSLNECYCGE